MARQITQYSVFIGSPGGLNAEREEFKSTIDRFNRHHAVPAGVIFKSVGWEETLPGHGRPQAIINAELGECDYAVFIFHDRWGSPSSLESDVVGTEEEWNVAETLYEEATIRNIHLFFKSVNSYQLSDPGEQLKKVLEFKAKIEKKKRYMYNEFGSINEFRDKLEALLASWLRQHKSPHPSAGDALSSEAQLIDNVADASAVSKAPPFADMAVNFLIEKSRKMIEENAFEKAIAFAEEALIETKDPSLKAAIQFEIARANFSIGNISEAISLYTDIIFAIKDSNETDDIDLWGRSMINKALSLYKLDRKSEAFLLYSDVIARLCSRSEDIFVNQVAKSYNNQGSIMIDEHKYEEAIVLFDKAIDLLKLNNSKFVDFRLVRSMYSKSVALKKLKRYSEAASLIDSTISRFDYSRDSGIKQIVTYLKSLRISLKYE